MRIRAIFLAVVLLSVLPAAFIGFWSHEASLKREVSAAQQRSMLSANHLKSHLQRYQDDLAAFLNSISVTQSENSTIGGLDRLMKQLHIRRLATVDYSTGRVVSRMMSPATKFDAGINEAQIQRLKELAVSGKTVFSPVTAGHSGNNVIYAVQHDGHTFSVAEIDASFFVELADLVSFNGSGHAAIFDRAGNILAHPILAHPMRDWVATRKNLASLPPVKRMRFGEAGIDTFFSPALGEEITAAVTSVSGSGWGIMVPQTVSSIQKKAAESQSGLVFSLVSGVFIAILSGFLLSRYFVGPLEAMSERFRNDANRSVLTETEDLDIPLYVHELAEVHRNYNLLVRQVTRAQGEVERIAYYDTVTGLANRDNFNRRFEKVVADASAFSTGGALIYIDLDNFKQINDVHGHEAGDELLVAVADSLRDVVGFWHEGKSNDLIGEPLVARMGGDEFAVLVPGLTDADAANGLMEFIGKSVAQPPIENNRFAVVGTSIGCARFPLDGKTCEDILKRADMAMYKAKNSGRGRHVLFNTQHGMLTPGEIRHEIAEAIEQDQLCLYYQPQLCAKSRRVMGVEALVRWQHPTRGLQPPDLWLPEIVNSSIIVRLGEWVAERAIADLAELHATGRNISTAINIGSNHFLTPGFTEMLSQTADRHGVERGRVEIEVTEDALFRSATDAELVLSDLRNRGFRISIDDFGKGFSNMARLADLTVDFLKIDRSIVDGAQKNPRTRSILASAISMAHELGCMTIAEGVETVRQADFTTYMGADFLQGYYFAQPMPKEELMDWMKAWEGGTISGLNRQLLDSVA